MPEIIVNTAACDYITLTTFHRPTFRDVLNVILTKEEMEEASKASIPRYAGMRATFPSGSVFYGEGVQADGHAHWVIVASGGISDRVAFAVSGFEFPELRVTRVDFQITLEKPNWYRARNFADSLSSGEWNGRSRRPQLIENDGNDTVYIGSYGSDRFSRCYVKEGEWLRFEAVAKGEYAMAAWRRYKQVPTLAPAGIIVSELRRLPADPVKDLFGNALRGASSIDVTKQKPVKILSKTYIWLVRSVVPAINKLLNDHEAAGMTEQLLRDILADHESRSDV